MKSKMKFFERTYLFTLVLFLLFLNGCVFALAYYTHSGNVYAERQMCLTKERTAVEAYLRDLEETGEKNSHLLQISYCKFYGDKQIYLQFSKGDTVTRSTLPPGLQASEPGNVQDVRMDGKRYFVFTERVGTDGTLLTYATEVTHLDEQFLKLMAILVLVSLAASALLALFLYLLLRKLYKPLGNLSRATSEFAAGDLSVRADDSGTDEFSALAGNFNAMADRIGGQIRALEDTANQRQRMLDDLAHEMRTPLTGIHGYAEYICAARISEEEKIDAARFIMSESMRLKHISETLLDMAFVRENKIDPTELIVKELLILTRDRFWSRISEKDLLFDIEGGDFLLQGDRLLLELMLSNLTENACKACKQGGRICLGAYIKDGQKVLYVQDNGGGMTAEQLVNITTPFYRTDRSRNRKDGGTGLGLALCERIAAAHGATLSFSSTLGEGTTASVTFSETI